MNIDKFLDGNIKFRSFYRDSMYKVIENKDKSGLFNGPSSIFYTAFAIGYHFDKQDQIKPKAINHTNLVSLDREIKELMIRLILKRKPKLNEPKELWKEVETYAEYGIQVLFEALKNKNYELDISEILEKN